MTTALRRRLDSLSRMTTANGCTPGEAANAAAAAVRILVKLGDQAERLAERPEPYVARRQSRSGRRRTSRERAKEHRLRVGTVIDLHRWCRCGRGHGRFEVLSAIELGHAGMLRCVGCGRNGGWLTREDFQPGAGHLRE
jgi:hypothetical protein